MISGDARFSEKNLVVLSKNSDQFKEDLRGLYLL